jgi:predicted nuclease of predicted toxin-antitoxin system
VKLLFDENLSASLPGRLADLFQGSAHLRDIGLMGADDVEIWTAASEKGFSVVTKDDDFRERSILRGSPPKVIMISVGNCSTDDLERLLRGRAAEIRAFADDQASSLLELG